MKRLALVLALAVPLTPAAHAQNAADAWADAYRLVLVRDWPAADSALAAFAGRYPADANAARAAFWRCYAVEQTNRADAADCYRRVADTDGEGRWKNEARTRLVALSARPAQAGTSLTLSSPVSVKTVTQDGTTHTFVLQTRPDGSVDTLTSTVVGNAYAFAWGSNGETGRLRGEAARLRGEAQRLQAEAQRMAAEAQRLAQEATRAKASDRAELVYRVREAQDAAAELQREAADLHREAAEVEREAAEAMREAAQAPRPSVAGCNEGDCADRSWTWTWRAAASSADTLSPDERVAVLAVEALGQSGQDESVDDLRRLAVAGRTAALRGAALSALGRIGTDHANRAVLDLAARNDGLSPDDYARLVLALQRIAERSGQTAEAVAALERIGRIPTLRVAAIQTIGQIEGPEALAALWRLADDESLSRDKTSAALAYLAVRPDPDPDRLVGRLETLAHNDGDRQAVDALGRLQQRSDAATRALERLAASAADSPVRLAALTALVHRPTENTVPLLVRLARDADARVARTAVQALGMLNTPEARRALLNLAQGQ
ncbi:MAG: HEAT repeat domain-containing protein [Bacteroidetes bacterium]|nr:HEAT repeat domain-containing protein [Bacteroidota bacterium]